MMLILEMHEQVYENLLRWFLFCHKQFGWIYIFTATKMDAFEDFWILLKLR